MEAILNFDQALDVGLFDRVVNALFTGVGEEVLIADIVCLKLISLKQSRAQKIVTQFQDHPDAWQRADFILENATNNNSKVPIKIKCSDLMDDVDDRPADSRKTDSEPMECTSPRAMRRD